ncbi:ethanolamine ammonia-lyase reactivating factor EutA [Cohnella suwonensis]|uniref:Ethanolamine ammonia-lyase reactivating factor EutA n=1 Tax=Cohnella suwonensis TaxID=696072 RepID=A0ABW0LZ54_9BACL
MNGQPEELWLTSAGIDVGTSTTKLVVSRLKLARASGALSLPRFEISAREVLYAGPVVPTPLAGADEIDAVRLWEIVSAQLAEAGVEGGRLETGAVIVTGETATKRNASAIVHLLAERAGKFVVATAGPDLEGLLAGKGAGADKRSLDARGAILNVDVGGGTANVAIFRRGRAVGTATYAVGGNLIRIDAEGRVASVSPTLRPWLAANGYGIAEGSVLPFSSLREICRKLCEDMLDDLTGRRVSSSGPNAGNVGLLRIGAPPLTVPDIEVWSVSGGIGGLMFEAPPRDLAETARYGDIGPLLACELRACMADYRVRFVAPDQTVRATVIGAGTQSADISGATVFMEAGTLPVRNLPVAKAVIGADPNRYGEAVEAAIGEGLTLHGPDGSPPFALALAGESPVGYAQLQKLAEELSGRFVRSFPRSKCLVVVCERDMAQALGQALRKRCGGRPKVLCVDQVRVEHGDYIDLGEPISGMMIPVVAKTLAFPNGRG